MAVKCILVGQTPNVLDGVTENVQTQLDNKQSTITTNGVLKGDGVGNITAADMTEVELVDLPPTVSKTSISLAAASWTGTASPYTQSVTISGGTAASQVDIQANATVIQQMMNDGTNAIYIANNNGTFTAYAVGEKPTANLIVQLTVYDVIMGGGA